jgi:hypothetical protein
MGGKGSGFEGGQLTKHTQGDLEEWKGGRK